MRAYITENYGHGKLLMWREGRTAYISDNNGYAVATIEDSYNRVFAGYSMSGMSKLCYDPNTNEVREGLVPTGYCLYRLSDDHRHIYKGGGYGNPLYTCSEPDPLLLIAAVAHFGDSPESSNAIDYPQSPSEEQAEDTPWYHESRESQVADMKYTKWLKVKYGSSECEPTTFHSRMNEPSIVDPTICLFVYAPLMTYFFSYPGLILVWVGIYCFKLYFENRKAYRIAGKRNDSSTILIPQSERQRQAGCLKCATFSLISLFLVHITGASLPIVALFALFVLVAAYTSS